MKNPILIVLLFVSVIVNIALIITIHSSKELFAIHGDYEKSLEDRCIFLIRSRDSILNDYNRFTREQIEFIKDLNKKIK